MGLCSFLILNALAAILVVGNEINITYGKLTSPKEVTTPETDKNQYPNLPPGKLKVHFHKNCNNNNFGFAVPTLGITGGEPALIGEFSFMAALGWTDERGNLSFKGGGMVISRKMVLTAAHCVYVDGKLPDTVLIGGYSLSEFQQRGIKSFSAVNVTIFPEYRSNQAYHDIAILELNEPVFGWDFSSVCLWKDQKLISDDITAIGYGLTEFAGKGSPDLLKANLTVFPPDFCEPFFKRQRKFKSGLLNTQICAGDMNGVKDTCQGDSGGPLIMRHNGTMYAVGVTSTGQACSGFPPAIYTKISSYIGWITKVLKEQGDELDNCDY